MQLAEQGQNLRPAEIDLQIKIDLQALAQTFNSGVIGDEADSYIYSPRRGFFGAQKWKREFANLLYGHEVQIDEVKILQTEGDTVKAAVVYSFAISPYSNGNNDVQSAFWKGTRQEVLKFKSGHTLVEPERTVWQIVPPATEPPAINMDVDAEDVLWNNVAYHFAQKSDLKPIKTSAERSINNLETLSWIIGLIVQDYGDVYALNPRYIIEAVISHVQEAAVVQVPDTNEIYTFNANLSGLKTDEVKTPAQTVLFYEGQNETPTFRYDGKAAICFADGHVALVTPEQAKSLIWKP